MTWAKGDDRYDDNPKIKRAWRLSGYAVGLHWQAITASARHESDGLVDPEWLADKLAHLPRAAGIKAVDTLVRLNLFERLPAGEVLTLDDGCGFTVAIGPLVEDAHVVHDFLDYNDSSANLADRRRRDAERKAARRRGESRRIPDGVRTDSIGSPEASPPESRHPGPSRPDPGVEPPDPPQAGGDGHRAALRCRRVRLCSDRRSLRRDPRSASGSATSPSTPRRSPSTTCGSQRSSPHRTGRRPMVSRLGCWRWPESWPPNSLPRSSS